MRSRFIINASGLVCAATMLAACATRVESNPPRTATEQMLISTAADRAADKLSMNLRPGSTLFVDAGNFEGTDSKYAVGAIRAAFMRNGAALTDDRKKADIVVEIRAGALSTDRDSFLIGIPSFNIPIPLASGTLPFPEIALYKESTQKGVAKFAAIAYTAEDGHPVAAEDPHYGFSQDVKYTALFFISWEDNDAVPKDKEAAPPPAASGD